MHRSAPRLSRILACAAVPVMLVVAGCSSDSDGGKKDSGSSASSAAPSASKKAEPTVEPAKFAQLPDPCKSITRKTVTSLVPSAKSKNGTATKSSDLTSRAGCSWNGLDDNGVKGSQYRWLDVGFTRFDSDQALGSGAKRAQQDFAKQVDKAKAAEGAKKVAETPADGIGDQATTVTYDLAKTSEDFKYATVVARTENVVITLTYNGAGYAGAKTPSADDIRKGAEKAAKEVVAAVAADKDSGSTAPSQKATDKADDPKSSDSGSDDHKKSTDRKTSARKSSVKKTS
ncbi:DUF3558 domain-containing protein [Streptomyces sp. NBC_00378]|uniref:DUF3558 family protein n=1 Tax=unclassified Streptomyces TaxID=2593676 RepID=UPI0022513BC0|nr:MULTISPECIES: DUF3558 family protein [unclassified Streptomyces]MCX5111266.1 DUF3558 domain-containing protein [Streptomyces sp. NBC_00378]